MKAAYETNIAVPASGGYWDIRARIKQGGHGVARVDVFRRFDRGWRNFLQYYRPLADAWLVYNNSGSNPVLVEQGS